MGDPPLQKKKKKKALQIKSLRKKKLCLTKFKLFATFIFFKIILDYLLQL